MAQASTIDMKPCKPMKMLIGQVQFVGGLCKRPQQAKTKTIQFNGARKTFVKLGSSENLGRCTLADPPSVASQDACHCCGSEFGGYAPDRRHFRCMQCMMFHCERMACRGTIIRCALCLRAPDRPPGRPKPPPPPPPFVRAQQRELRRVQRPALS